MEAANSRPLLSGEPDVTKETLLLRLLDELSAARNLAAKQGLRGNPDDSSSEPLVDYLEPKADAPATSDQEDLDPSEKRRATDAVHQYQRCTEDLDACLQTLQDTSARLGASMGVLSAAHKFRQRLRVVLISFRLNAEALHPDLKSILHPTNALLSQRDSTHGVPVEELPEQLSLLANDASAFLEQITFFSDFVQDAVKEPIMGCRNDLDYLADCLNGYTMSTDLPLRAYVHQRSLEIGAHLQDITNAVRTFIDVGLPAIRGAQQAHSNNLLKLSTVATLFSGITIQAVQSSLQHSGTVLERVTTLLYFTSLVLSISAAVNSLLSHAWTDAPYRPPKHKVPSLVFCWINHSPLFLMALSVALFSAGLVCFCYYAVDAWISNTVLILTVLCHLGLAISFAWFAAERWAYRQHQGTETAMGALIGRTLRFRAQSRFTINIDMKQVGRRIASVLKSIAGALATCLTWSLRVFCMFRKRRGQQEDIWNEEESIFITPFTDSNRPLDQDSHFGAATAGSVSYLPVNPRPPDHDIRVWGGLQGAASPLIKTIEPKHATMYDTPYSPPPVFEGHSGSGSVPPASNTNAWSSTNAWNGTNAWSGTSVWSGTNAWSSTTQGAAMPLVVAPPSVATAPPMYTHGFSQSPIPLPAALSRLGSLDGKGTTMSSTRPTAASIGAPTYATEFSQPTMAPSQLGGSGEKGIAPTRSTVTWGDTTPAVGLLPTATSAPTPATAVNYQYSALPPLSAERKFSAETDIALMEREHVMAKEPQRGHSGHRSGDHGSSTGVRVMPPQSISSISRASSPTTTRIDHLRPELKKMVAVRTSQGHSMVINRLQFHPDGLSLATCGWDNKTILWNIPRVRPGALTAIKTLPHSSGPVEQLTWSPDGSFLLTRSAGDIELWNRDGTLRSRIFRLAVTSVAWLRNSRGILTAEGNLVVQLDVDGREVTSYPFEKMEVNKVVAIPDGQRVLVTATLRSSPNGLVSQTPRVERCLAVYNTSTRSVESRVPILHNADSMVLSHFGVMVLVSYGNKAPPQLWQVKMKYTREGGSAKITYVRTYRPKSEVDFSGAASFGGTNNDELVLIPTKHGTTLVWDRGNGNLCHTFKGEDGAGSYACNAAWNSARFMLASTSPDGRLCLWTSSDPIPMSSAFPEGETTAGSPVSLPHLAPQGSMTSNRRPQSRQSLPNIPFPQTWSELDFTRGGNHGLEEPPSYQPPGASGTGSKV